MHSRRRHRRWYTCGATAADFEEGDRVKLRYIAVLGGLLAGSIFGLTPMNLTAAPPAKQAKPAISEEASAALLRMGQTLRAEKFSFQARTIRVYAGPNDEPLHIFHTLKITLRRPNKLLAEVTGDDGHAERAIVAVDL